LAETERVFEALAHQARRQVVLLLAHHGPDLPSGYLASRLNHSWPTTTRHLHVLVAAGIVSVHREGRNAIYQLERDELLRVVGGWLSLLEAPNASEIWRSPGPRSARKGRPT
jgi:DNA-binding transcriptional ArsR family regulator